MSDTPTFEFDGKKYKIELTMKEVLNILPEQFGVKLLGIFADNTAIESAIRELVFNDERTLQMMYHFVSKTNDMISFENFVEKIPNLATLDEFRDAFWAAAVLFSGPLKKQAMMEVWKTFKQEVKKANFSSEQSSSNA